MKKTLAVLMTLLLLAMLIVSCEADSPVIIHKVTFNSGNGSEAKVESVIDGEKTVKPSDPVMTGYTFLGWYDGDTLFDFETSVKQDYSLTAKWQIQTFTVSFSVNGREGGYGSQTINYGGKVDTTTVSDPTKAGHAFLGWFDGSEKFDFDTPITKDITLTAKWGYKVTFDPDNGDAATYVYLDESTGTIAEGAVENPQKESFAFKGWYKEDGTKFEFGKTKVTADLKLTAKWKKTYTIIGNYNQEGIPNDYYEVEEGYMFHFTDKDENEYDWDITPIVEEYNKTHGTTFVFEGWYYNGEEEPYKPGTDKWNNLKVPVNGPITLTAKWKDQTEFRTVTFVDDDEAATVLLTAMVEYGKAVYIPTTPYKEGYTFVCWTKDGKEYDVATAVKSDITLKATWKINTYTVTFDTKGGTTATYTKEVEYKGTVSEPSDTPEKYYGFFEKCDFKGWYNGSEEFNFNTPITKDITLTAKWTYEVILKTADDDHIETQTVEEGGTVTKPVTNPKKDGCIFDKWTTDRDGKNEYDFESEVNENNNGPIFAQFITLKVGECVQVGTFPSNYASEIRRGKSIPWRVLDISADKKSALVISLDILEIHSFYIHRYFSYSDIRNYINNDGFIKKYGLENVDMCKVEVSPNEDSQKTTVGSGSDKMFLLSATEAETYFSNTDDRRAWYIYSDRWYGRPTWWLRTSSTWTEVTTRHIQFYSVEEYGRIQKIDYACYMNGYYDMPLRPAFWIKLNT